MQLYHESSSLSINDKIDVMYGKYFPSTTYNTEKYIDITQPFSSSFFNSETSSSSQVRIFCEIYGVFGDLTGRFADRMDKLEIPCPKNCYVPENYLFKNYPLDTLVTIAEEPGFWYGVLRYDWFWIIFETFFKLSSGNLYLLSDWEYGEQLSDRYLWVKKSFGSSMLNNLIWVNDEYRHMIARDKRDILIDNDLSNIEKWINAGGSAFYWPEIHRNCDDKVKILSKRFELLSKVVESLN